MQKKKQVFTWPLSTLIIVVSFLSVLVILRQVEAAWQEPSYLPEDTNLNTFVFNPLLQSLDLGGKNITGAGNININGSGTFTSLTVGGVPYVPGGGGSSGSDWLINTGASNALYYTTTTASGYVGIGTATPSTKLHIYDINSGPIITLSGLNDKYRGLTIKNESGNEQWFTGADTSNNYVIRRNGTTDYLGVNATSGNVSVAQNLAVGGNLTVTGTINGASGSSSSNNWLINTGASNALYYTTTTASGYVGIGTNAPNKLLHLYSTSPNAELDIQSVSGAGNHWAIYHDASTDQLRFWKSAGSNVLTLAANGRIGVGTTPDNNNMLRISTATVGTVGVYGENSSTDWSFYPSLNPNNIGVKGVASTAVNGGTGVSGTGYFGVKGSGFYGIYGSSSLAGGIGVYGVQGTGAYAAQFDGQILLNGDVRFGSGKNIYITNSNGAPLGTDCPNIIGSGKLYVDNANSRLYVCINGVWKSALLN